MTRTIAGEPAALAAEAADLLAAALVEVLRRRPTATLALPGGRSVARVFAALAARDDLPWAQVHLLMVDERRVPADHPEGNFARCEELLAGPLGDRALLPRENVHPYRWRQEEPDHGLAAYNRTLERLGGTLDVLLLSAGEDGHIASLFPDHPSVRAPGPGFIAVDHAPKPPPGRISASTTLIGRARCAVLLLLGEGKRSALAAYRDPSRPAEACPAKLVDRLPEAYLLTDLE